MKKNSFAATMFAVTVAWAGSAGAVTLDFISHIDGTPVGERAVEASPNLNPFSSIHVSVPTTALGYGSSITDTSPYAYFDSNDAGIGVCKEITANNQCNPASDDNLTEGEILGLSWAGNWVLQSLSFRGEDHPTDPSFLPADFFNYSVDGGNTWFKKNLKNAKDGVVDFGIVLTSGQQILLGFNSEQYYVSAAVLTAVPEPGTLALLGLGLVGLGMSRRRKTA